jgi:hypothetical protein
MYRNNTDKSSALTAYQVMRRERPAVAWEDVAIAVIREAALVEQVSWQGTGIPYHCCQ